MNNIELIPVNCQVCNSQSFDQLHQVNEHFSSYFNYLSLNICQCSQCGFIFTSPRPSEQDYTNYYINSGVSSGTSLSLIDENNPIYQQYVEVAKVLKPIMQSYSSGQLLEVGCGNGIGLKLLSTQGNWQLSGIDPAPRSEFAIRHNLDVEQMTLDEICTNNKRYQMVVCSHVLEHLWDPKKAVEQMKSLLTDDGTLVIIVPNIMSINDSGSEFFDVEHVSHFSYHSLYNLLKACGFNHIERPDISELHVALIAKNFSAESANSYRPIDTKNTCRFLVEGYSQARKSAKQKVSNNFQALFKDIFDKNAKLAVFGAGNFSYQLFAEHPALLKQVAVVFDSNPDKAKESFFGVEITTPSQINNYDIDTVFIASKAFKNDIDKTIQQLTNKPLTLISL